MADFTYREELGNFALEIETPCVLGFDYGSQILRFHPAENYQEEDQWLYVYESHRVGDNFQDLLIDARKRMLQYFKSDYINTDLHILQHWKSEFHEDLRDSES